VLCNAGWALLRIAVDDSQAAWLIGTRASASTSFTPDLKQFAGVDAERIQLDATDVGKKSLIDD
jgi:hypothetical protein